MKSSIKLSSMLSYFSAGTWSYTRVITSSITVETVRWGGVFLHETRRTQVTNTSDTIFIFKRTFSFFKKKKPVRCNHATGPYLFPKTQNNPQLQKDYHLCLSQNYARAPSQQSLFCV